jgi:hypothetical protein
MNVEALPGPPDPKLPCTRYLHTLTVALLLGTLWVADPVSGACDLRVMASSDVAWGDRPGYRRLVQFPQVGDLLWHNEKRWVRGSRWTAGCCSRRPGGPSLGRTL